MRSVNTRANEALAFLLTVAAAYGDDSYAFPNDPTRAFANVGGALPKFSRLGYSAAAQSAPRGPGDAKSKKRRRHRASSASSDTSSTAPAPGSPHRSDDSAPAAEAAAPAPAAAARRRFLPLPHAALLPTAAMPGAAPPHLRRYPQLFVGQLKKDAAAETLQAILAILLPHVKPVYIEPLHNRATGQGRGCAWLYLRSAQDASAVLELHHRVFLDADAATGGVGLWVCDCRGEEELRTFADSRVVDEYVLRKKKMLPRQPLVVERAARTMAPAAPAAVAWPAAASAVGPAAAISDAAEGPFPRAYPNEGIVLVAPKRYRNDPYAGAATMTPPTYQEVIKVAGPA